MIIAIRKNGNYHGNYSFFRVEENKNTKIVIRTSSVRRPFKIIAFVVYVCRQTVHIKIKCVQEPIDNIVPLAFIQ